MNERDVHQFSQPTPAVESPASASTGEGVVAAPDVTPIPSPAEGVYETPQPNEPGPVPYDRFKDVNDEKNIYKARAEEAERKLLEATQAQYGQPVPPQPQPQGDHVFDADTREAIRRESGVSELEQQVIHLQLAQQIPEYAENPQWFWDEYAKLSQPGPQGALAVAQALAAKKRAAESAQTVSKMAREQAAREQAKAEAGVPQGAPPQPEKKLDWADLDKMPPDQAYALVEEHAKRVRAARKAGQL